VKSKKQESVAGESDGPSTDAAPEQDALVKPKAKARAKKAAVPVEADAVENSVAEAEEPAAEPAKKAVKKAAKKAKSADSAVEELPQASLFGEEKAIQELEASVGVPEAAVVKPRKTKSVKSKGRDLVTDEPGAAEVAEVLHEHPVSHPEDSASEREAEEAAIPVGPEPKLERLQKILAKAGVASRRAAEEMILGGRVQINGKVAMELGTKADPVRDHVRVDGKLLQGPERIRYFVLNKPKGYVTTVSDPEGRPTVMQFFAGERERLYPVGRLDYLSEGLLLVTNDGELANKLTKAASGVEKTYLVKVAGQPTEEMLDALREGVVIERGRPGTHSGRVRTAPAKIRQVREGDNPWYEVVLIEGRNRELRKMFEEIGHHVEKIRRVGYGPLVLDQEPGKLRELEAEEVHALRLTADGKLKPRRRRGPAPAQLPTVAGKTVRYKKADGRPGFEPRARREAGPQVGGRPEARPEFKRAVRPEFEANSKPGFAARPKPEFKAGFKGGSGSRPDSRANAGPGSRPNTGPRAEFRPAGRPSFKAGSGPAGRAGAASPSPRGAGKFAAKLRYTEPPVTDYVLPPRKPGAAEADAEFEGKALRQGSGFNPDYKPDFRTGGKPAGRPDARTGSKPPFKPGFRADGPPKRFDAGARGADKPFRPAKPAFARPAEDDSDIPPPKTPGFRIEPVIDVPRDERPRRSGGFDRAGQGAKPFRPAAGRSSSPGGPAPAGGERLFKPRATGPAREGAPFRPRTESGRSASTGARPFRPGAKPAGRFGPGAARTDRPARTDRTAGSDRPDRTNRPDRPARPFTSRSGSGPGGPPSGRAKSFGVGDDRPREFRPRAGSTRPSGGARPAKPAFGGKPKTGPDGEPRIKERWRNSFTGKNKGRPKPKPKKDE
jgi:23S rRNA pseudouridine2605 synthase